jgi:hypothetical protein
MYIMRPCKEVRWLVEMTALEASHCCSQLQPTLGCVNQPTALVANECYHLVTNIPVNTAGREYMVMCYRGKSNSLREMRSGSNHGTSFRGLCIAYNGSLVSAIEPGDIDFDRSLRFSFNILQKYY